MSSSHDGDVGGWEFNCIILFGIVLEESLGSFTRMRSLGDKIVLEAL